MADLPQTYTIVRKGQSCEVEVEDHDALVRLRSELALICASGDGFPEQASAALGQKAEQLNDNELRELQQILDDANDSTNSATLARIDADFPDLGQDVQTDVIDEETQRIRDDIARSIEDLSLEAGDTATPEPTPEASTGETVEASGAELDQDLMGLSGVAPTEENEQQIEDALEQAEDAVDTLVAEVGDPAEPGEADDAAAVNGAEQAAAEVATEDSEPPLAESSNEPAAEQSEAEPPSIDSVEMANVLEDQTIDDESASDPPTDSPDAAQDSVVDDLTGDTEVVESDAAAPTDRLDDAEPAIDEFDEIDATMAEAEGELDEPGPATDESVDTELATGEADCDQPDVTADHRADDDPLADTVPIGLDGEVDALAVDATAPDEPSAPSEPDNAEAGSESKPPACEEAANLDGADDPGGDVPKIADVSDQVADAPAGFESEEGSMAEPPAATLDHTSCAEPAPCSASECGCTGQREQPATSGAVSQVQQGFEQLGRFFSTHAHEIWKQADASLDSAQACARQIRALCEEMQTVLAETRTHRDGARSAADEAEAARREAIDFRDEAQQALTRAMAKASEAENAADRALREARQAQIYCERSRKPSTGD